jgi:hypothetical protein
MEKTDKSAEEILESTAGHPIDAMHQYAKQYAAQQLSEYKEVIKELLPVAQEVAEGMKCWTNHKEAIAEYGKLKTIIDRAKKMIEK